MTPGAEGGEGESEASMQEEELQPSDLQDGEEELDTGTAEEEQEGEEENPPSMPFFQ